MPTRKQRRRREKERRHEWEEVYVDSEGRELAPEEVEEILPEVAETRTRRDGPARAQQTAKGPRGTKSAKAGTSQRQPRGVQPPSWRRVFKRALIFAPLMYLFIALTQRDAPAVTHILFTLQLMLIFLPFSYLMDHMTHRIWKRRQAKVEGQAPDRKGRPAERKR